MSKLASHPIRIGLAVIALAVVGAGAYVFFSDQLTEETVAAADTNKIALGAQVYASQCAACHGPNLEGQPNWRERKPNGKMPAPPHDETGHTWHHDDQTLFALTKYGLSALVGKPVPTDMPAYEGVLTDVQIRAVLAYIKSQWPIHIQQRQSEATARAAANR